MQSDIRESRVELDELEFLSRAALTLAELRPDEDIFRFVAEQLATIAPDSVVVTSRFEPWTETTVVEAIAGPPDLLGQALLAIGRDPKGLVFHVNEEARRGMSEGKLVRLDGGLRQLTFDTWSAEIAHRVESSIGVRSVHAQPFARRGDFLGTASIISRGADLEHARLIEAFTRLAAVAIQRLRAETRLRESECRFRMLAEGSADVIFRLVLKPNFVLDYVSPAATKVTGYTPAELYAQPELGMGCLYAEAWTSSTPPRATPAEPLAVRCKRRNGAMAWTEQQITPVLDDRGDVVAIQGVVRDVTTRKSAEDALIDADRRKDEFLAVLSHELRNPLSPIQNALYILGRVDPASDQAKRARAILERQVAHLTQLIDDLLDVTRITRGKIGLHRETLDLNAIVRSTVEDHNAMFADRRVALEVHVPEGEVWVNGDATRLAQIVGNLLQNSAKFTPAGGRASVSVETDAGAGVLRVSDTGAGIAPEMLPHLFEPFTQADTTIARSKGGLGLGLMLVKGLVEMHGGTVTARSEGPDKGAEFAVRLPLAHLVPDERAAAPTLSTDGHVRVLVIEDNVDAADTLQEALQLGEHVVEVAHEGHEGIAKARAFRPDVVLCDIGLPGLDGYEVARALREIPELHGVALVALTGYASPEDIDRAMRAGFDRHLAKPPDIGTLERTVRELARHARHLHG